MAMEVLRVLVVDDEPGMRAGVGRALRDFRVRLPDVNGEVGFEILQAGSGEEAMDIIAAQSPHLLLLDHKLPGISGLDVLDRLAAGAAGDLLTIMITAYASLDTAIAATKRGAYDFLAKPFTPAELKGAVHKAAEHFLLQRQARRMAEEKRQVRFQFISVLAHELKSPLAATEGFLRIIKDRSAGNDQAVYDHMLTRTLLRLEGMRKLIADLLDLTRIESGRKKRELTTVDLAAVAADCIEATGPAAKDMEVTIALTGGPVTMAADRGEIEIVLNNLVSNAVKYNRKGGRVDVTVCADGETAKIVVADTGIGMAPQDAARLFGEFTRIKTTQTRNILGSGLGLSIVKKLAALYGGDVTIASTPGVG
jgi:two-component system, sensor histidine kinase and response regulator